MYILRPIPITICPEKFIIYPTVNITTYHSPYYDTQEWDSSVVYTVDDSVNMLGYDFVSLTDQNIDIPSQNFVGRSPRSDDSIKGNGKGSWIRKGVTNKLRCFVPSAAGYTECPYGYVGTINVGESNDSPELTLLPQETLHLFCSGIVANYLQVSAQAFNGGVIQGSTSGTTLPTNPQAYREIDGLMNPELPYRKSSFLYPSVCGLDAEEDWSITDQFSFSMSPTTSAFYSRNVVFAENIFVGRLSKIGIMQYSNHKLGTQDRSVISVDDWGVSSLSKRRVSRAVNCEIILTPDAGKSIVEKIQTIYSFLMYLRGSVNVFLLTNLRLDTITMNTLGELPYEDVVTGVIKSLRISDFSKYKALLTVTIESIPSGYEIMPFVSQDV